MTEKTATPVDAYRVQTFTMDDGVKYLTLRIEPNGYEAFERLPKALMVDGEVYGFTGWCSDTGRVFYRNDVTIAYPR